MSFAHFSILFFHLFVFFSLFFFLSFFFFLFFFFFLLFRAIPVAYGSSQAGGLIRAIVAGLHHSHSNVGSKPCLWPSPQSMATPDPWATDEARDPTPILMDSSRTRFYCTTVRPPFTSIFLIGLNFKTAQGFGIYLYLAWGGDLNIFVSKLLACFPLVCSTEFLLLYIVLKIIFCTEFFHIVGVLSRSRSILLPYSCTKGHTFPPGSYNMF